MNDVHPNIAVLSQFDPTNAAGSADVLSETVTWHFFNPRLPDLQGDYVGPHRLGHFFGTLNELTNGTFKVNPISITPVGDELLVAHCRNSMILDGQPIETDAVVVWRIVNGKIAEVWDIPAVYQAPATT